MAQADGTAVDIHSHAGNLTRASYGRDSLLDVAGPMRKGGLSVICLAIVANSPIIQRLERPHAAEPRPQARRALRLQQDLQFAKLHELARGQSMPIVKTAADLRAARAAQPSVIVTSEGGDFLEGKIERLDEAYQRWQLRQLQLTHYRPNELGDIQTEPAVHGGLTDFGVEVIRRCNALGIVVDVAHGTFDLVKRAVATTSKPLVLSHTGAQRPADALDAVHHLGSCPRHRLGARRDRHLAGHPGRDRAILCRQHRPHGRCSRCRLCRRRHRPDGPHGTERHAELRRPAATCRRVVAALQTRRNRTSCSAAITGAYSKPCLA